MQLKSLHILRSYGTDQRGIHTGMHIHAFFTLKKLNKGLKTRNMFVFEKSTSHFLVILTISLCRSTKPQTLQSHFYDRCPKCNGPIFTSHQKPTTTKAPQNNNHKTTPPKKDTPWCILNTGGGKPQRSAPCWRGGGGRWGFVVGEECDTVIYTGVGLLAKRNWREGLKS